MVETNFWTMDRFPVVYEGDEVKAVLVDVTSFAQIELIITMTKTQPTSLSGHRRPRST
jgi:hypothetical protein